MTELVQLHHESGLLMFSDQDANEVLERVETHWNKGTRTKFVRCCAAKDCVIRLVARNDPTLPPGSMLRGCPPWFRARGKLSTDTEDKERAKYAHIPEDEHVPVVPFFVPSSVS